MGAARTRSAHSIAPRSSCYEWRPTYDGGGSVARLCHHEQQPGPRSEVDPVHRRVLHHNAQMIDALCIASTPMRRAALTGGEGEGSRASSTSLLRARSRSIEEVHGKDIERDNELRAELNAMAARLESGHGELEAKIAERQPPRAPWPA